MNNEVKFSTRFVAYLLDILLIYIVAGFLLNTRLINPNYDKYMDTQEKYSELVENASEENMDILTDEFKDIFYDLNKYGVAYNIATLTLLLLYFGVFQKFNNGQTLGKKIMKIKVVDNNDGNNISLLKFIIRTIPMQFIYIGSVLTLLLNSILVYILNGTKFLYAYSLIVTIVGIINIVSLMFVIFRKDKRSVSDLIVNTKVVKE